MKKEFVPKSRSMEEKTDLVSFLFGILHIWPRAAGRGCSRLVPRATSSKRNRLSAVSPGRNLTQRCAWKLKPVLRQAGGTTLETFQRSRDACGLMVRRGLHSTRERGCGPDVGSGAAALQPGRAQRRSRALPSVVLPGRGVCSALQCWKCIKLF